ncbi:quinic acid utilization activator [Dothidotthia symphoricarpi CBS 119687]|uniref:Quinic acid utilization activator n=1 Tax=Dothidotthia symphoricarpi CBS 119687 TaxID=1392245 RepID=A0A6A6A7J0_9PLEO|nr:quinic acid utilization activator [Dothidotthia symphoricarpi CBS 119687]KAF2126611.1 quinic acid utilization activator [Dothidotthia symphoricarpi CBS 119687]
MTLAFVFQQDTEIEALVNKQLAQENTILLSKGTKESNRLHKSWRRSKFCRDITKVLAGEHIGIGDDTIPSSDEESEVDAEDASLLNTTPMDQLQEKQMPWTSDMSLIPRHLAAPSVPDRHHPITQQPVPFLGLTPLPVDFWMLLETYSTYTQSWLPICEKLDVLKLSYSYPEEGLALSQDMPDSGCHAEMWSIFAVGCIQDSSFVMGSREPQHLMTPKKLYEISRQLIPHEIGNFDLNHVKALLNLAVFNISRSLLKAAWLLVGTASRIFFTLNESPEIASPRRKNILASCFLLDNLLALHLQRRPYLDKSDLAWAGKIEEDGLEEWQPWNGNLNLGTTYQSRLPTLALSSFNNLLEVVDILVSTARQPTARNFLHEMIGRLEAWKSSLPPKLHYVRSDSPSTPLTPPAVVLQLTYFATAFALVPSQAWLQRVLELLETLRGQLGFAKLPSIVICLLESIKRSSTNLNLDQVTRIRMHSLFADFDQACSITSGEAFLDTQSMPSVLAGTSPSVIQMRNPDAIHASPRPFSSQNGDSISEQYQPPTGSSALLDDLLPDMNHNRQQHTLQSLNPRPFSNAMDSSAFEPPTFDIHDPYNAFVPGDLESFFDELASLHGAKKLQNQTQFMQNLGYSSEVSMADLLAADPGQLMPLPSNLGPENNIESPHFSLDGAYDAG